MAHVTLTADALHARLQGRGEPDVTTLALLATASAVVERYAPNAPAAVLNEAAVRVAGWLARTPPGEQTSGGVGPVRLIVRPSASRNALRHSGASGLLAGWRRPSCAPLWEPAAITTEDDAMATGFSLTGPSIAALVAGRLVVVDATEGRAIKPTHLTLYKTGEAAVNEPPYLRLNLELTERLVGLAQTDGDAVSQLLWTGNLSNEHPNLGRNLLAPGDARWDWELPLFPNDSFKAATSLLVVPSMVKADGTTPTEAEWTAATATLLADSLVLTFSLSYDLLPAS